MAATNSKDERYDAFVLMSGGPDSATLLHKVKHDHRHPLALHFNTGLSANSFEMASSSIISKSLEIPFQVLDVSHFVSMGGGATPTIHSEAHVMRFGTAALLSMAAALAIQNGAQKVYIALHADDANEAAEYSSEFITCINSAIELAGCRCTILAPFHGMKKSSVLQLSKELEVPLHLTWSCICPIEEKQCGTCGACRARRLAAEEINLIDRTNYKFE